MAGWCCHDDGEGDEPVQPDRPAAAHLWRLAPADRRGRRDVHALIRGTVRMVTTRGPHRVGAKRTGRRLVCWQSGARPGQGLEDGSIAQSQA